MTRTYSKEEQANLEVVIDYFTKTFINADFEAGSVHIGPYYRQHNPMVADGPEGLRFFIEEVLKKMNAKMEIIHIMVDGDRVIVHGRAEMVGRQSAIIDIFRLENGKVVEHWDVIQQIPETSANANTMF